jgi:hypothetical protein
MADEMSDRELAEIEGRLQFLPPGPWQTEGAQVMDGFTPVVHLVTDANVAEFISHCRVDVPRLLVEVRRLRAQLADRGH